MLLVYEHGFEGIRESRNITKTPDGLGVTLIKGFDQGWLKTEEFDPKRRIGFRSIQLIPQEAELDEHRFAFVDPQQQLWCWDAESHGFIKHQGDQAPPNTIEDIREGIAYWEQPLRLYIDQRRDHRGHAGYLEGYRVAAEFMGTPSDIVGYAIQFAIATLINDPPVELVRWGAESPVKPPPPPEIEQRFVMATRSAMIGPSRQIAYSYRIPVTELYGDFQVEFVPCVLARQLNSINPRTVVQPALLQNQGERHIPAITRYCDIPIELTIIAADPNDRRAVADHIISRIDQEGHLYLPPYGLSIGCMLKGDKEMEEPLSAIAEGQLPSALVELCLVNMPI